MRVAIHQPQYWPWPRYIHKIMSSDIFVYLDTVQFSKNGFQNRNQIKTAQGTSWLTVSVKHEFGQRILETEVADSKALRKHLKTVEANYAHTSGYQQWKNELHRLFNMQTGSLCQIAIASTEWMLEKLGVQTRRIRASEILNAKGHNSTLVASICKSLNATSYLTGTGALDYMNRDDFSKNRCEVWIQEWNPFVYDQVFPQVGFVPALSMLDLLLNCPDTAAQLIESAGSWKLLWDIT